MKKTQIDLFEKCIELLEAGVPIDECFKQYPQLTTETKSMLKDAKNLLQLSDVEVAGELMEQNRARIMQKARLLHSQPIRRNSGITKVKGLIHQLFSALPALTPLTRKLVLIIGITGFLILFSSGLVIASAKSLPGDSLYPVKRVVEDISIHIVPNHVTRIEYEDNYSHQRVVEVQRLLELNRVQNVAFEGILEAMDGNSWMVSGIRVNISSGAQIINGLPDDQSIEIGSVIEVEGKTTTQGSVMASEIHLREYKYIGTVEKMDANYWQISGNQVFLTKGSQIDPGIRQGDDVTLLIRSEDDGLYALAILHDIRPTPMPYQSAKIGSTIGDSPESEDNSVYQLTGRLENITAKYWVINGEIVFIANTGEIPENLQIGDEISVDYRIEANGSYTALSINVIAQQEDTEEYQSQETPESDNSEDNHDHPEITTTPHEDDEAEKTPEYHSTPEPTDDH
jgi:hypothetical protein